MYNTGRDFQSYFQSTWMSKRANNPRNMKVSLVKRGLVTGVYLGGALGPNHSARARPESKASLSDSYRSSPLTAPNSRFLFDPPEKFPLPHIGLLWMRHATGLAAAGSQIFVIFSKTIPPPNPFPLGYLYPQSNWIPPRSRASILNQQAWVVAAESSRYVFFFSLCPCKFLSLEGTCDGDAN